MKNRSLFLFIFLVTSKFFSYGQAIDELSLKSLKSGFNTPPNSAKPGVYWYFMDGNITEKSITSDLESMKKAGIGNLVFLEVNVGVPRGSVDFLSDKWQTLFKYAVQESERLGIEITLGIGPGWTGSGGPWVMPAQSMQHLVSSITKVTGASQQKIKLPLPLPKNPYFGEGAFTPDLKREWQNFYEDVTVLAYPTPAVEMKIADIDEKALYYRAPYSSVPNVKQHLLQLQEYPKIDQLAGIRKSEILDLSKHLQPDGTLNWVAPAGNWTIMRFGRRNNGAITRPAPTPGLGFEADKFDTVALHSHLDNYIGKLLRKIGKRDTKSEGGLKLLHLDSWEMGAQNWTSNFRSEFIKRRGYDPQPYYPVYAGLVVESSEISERFLWDLRQTSQELVLEYHAGAVKKYAHRNGMRLSIEPYDMNPTADLELGAVADVPMSEFWSQGLGFNSSFSVVEATSIAHVNGNKLTPAEAFTSQNNEGWKQYPGVMKNQGDWAFAAGVNRFVYHTFQNQFLPDSLRPGATMGPYGVHWDRNQTWWPMVEGYHAYIARCSYMLQQGRTVADVLYLSPEGSPHVFRPPFSAFNRVNDTIPDRKGYNFDGCAPGQLYKASVINGEIVFPGGARYKLLVLPAIPSMSIPLLEKIIALVNQGAKVVGPAPSRTPGLANYLDDAKKMALLTQQIWGTGKIIWNDSIAAKLDNLYPTYEVTSAILSGLGIEEDFETTGAIRYTHRTHTHWDAYFIANTTAQPIVANAKFRSVKGIPQLWDPQTGKTRPLTDFAVQGAHTIIPLQLDGHQSYFVVFSADVPHKSVAPKKKNFEPPTIVAKIEGSWNVAFDPKWGGPENIVFDHLTDWTTRAEEGIKYYSGIAIYTKTFELPSQAGQDQLYLDFGLINHLARVTLNGKDLGVLWTAPWRVAIPKSLLRKQNKLQIEVANIWPNRMIGDQQMPGDGIKNGEWPEWLIKGLPRPGKRYTFSTFEPYRKDSPLYKSGLLGPVTIRKDQAFKN